MQEDNKNICEIFMKLVVVFSLFFLTSCSGFYFPGVHRINIQQGNFITQQMVDKLKPGMTKNQVRFVMGEAVLGGSLEKDRWDYIHTIKVSGGDTLKATLTLHFVNNRLDRFEGDYVPTKELKRLTKEANEAEKQASQSKKSKAG